MVEKLIPNLFPNDEDCEYLWIYAKLRAIKMYWNYAADHLLLPHIKLF